MELSEILGTLSRLAETQANRDVPMTNQERAALRAALALLRKRAS